MKRKVAKFAGLIVFLLAIGGLLFAWSGLYNVAATAGHWPMTAWLLHFAMRNSVETHAMPLKAPPLDGMDLVERGGGHYETGCVPCHGAPGSPANRIPNEMLPEPPYLPAAVDQWTAEELFWIVRHGLKYTGMPAWPAEGRDDEVWAVTAFLLRLPQMSAEEYAALAKGPDLEFPTGSGEPEMPDTPGEVFTLSHAALLGACARCHGLDGTGRASGAFPRLDMQSPDYLYRALQEYASGVRPSGIMQPVAAALDDAQMARLARHYAEAAAEAQVRATDQDAPAPDLGMTIAAQGIPERGVGACGACHGVGTGPQNPAYPAVDGQYASYISQQLRLFRDGVRSGTAYADIMAAVARNMTEEEIEAVAAYYSALSAPRTVATVNATEASPPR
jgi:cytochrome c553